MQFLCHVYTVHRLCSHFPHVSQDICSAPSSGAGRPTLAVENSHAVYPGGGGIKAAERDPDAAGRPVLAPAQRQFRGFRGGGILAQGGPLPPPQVHPDLEANPEFAEQVQ